MSAPASRLKATAFWVFKLLFALLFIATASAKLTGQPMMVKEFDIIGFGQWFRLFTGAVEALSAVLLLIPRSSQLGAAGMFLISVGARRALTNIRSHSCAALFSP